IDYLAGAIRSKADEITGKPSEKTPQQRIGEGFEAFPTTEATEVTEVTDQQHGGYLHGLGTGTSDNIPINASAGEYVVKASEVARPGVLAQLEDINQGRIGFQAGGLVTAEERRLMLAAGFDPDNPNDVEVWRRVRIKPKQPMTGKPAAGVSGATGTGQISMGEVFRGPPGPPGIAIPGVADSQGRVKSADTAQQAI